MNLLDFEYLENNLDTKNLYGCDSCIANIFLLQDKYNIQLKLHKNILFRYYYGDENRTGYGFPIPVKGATGDYLKTALEFIFEESAREKRMPAFCLITQEEKNQIDACMAEFFPERKISWKTNRDDCDYIYLRENLAELPGSHYQKKRNHISRFNRTYGDSWEFKTFPENDIASDILAVSQKWFEEKDGDSSSVLQLEHASIKSALENADLLRIRGGVLYINGEAAAMTLASPISDSILDVIYEKSVAEYEKNGAYAVINQQFSKHCGSFLYLNREEDMGVEGLRKAKLSYKPSIILEKFYGTIQ
ncbi:MAG: phosphatidylglycerol lysyltransferase domain-containing protein [Treponema sp.]|nr:phosphatidylglycerol lysyltransferase domain-containing protein [Treponema sp.]